MIWSVENKALSFFKRINTHKHTPMHTQRMDRDWQSGRSTCRCGSHDLERQTAATGQLEEEETLQLTRQQWGRRRQHWKHSKSQEADEKQMRNGAPSELISMWGVWWLRYVIGLNPKKDVTSWSMSYQCQVCPRPRASRVDTPVSPSE